MGGSTLLFNPSHGIRFRAHPTSPFTPPTGHSSCRIYRRDAVQRYLPVKSEANKGTQSQRNSKSNSELSSKSVLKISTDEANSQREHLSSLLKKIEDSIRKSPSQVEPKEKSMGEEKNQSLEPKSKENKIINDQRKSTEPPSNFDKLRRDDGNKAIATPRDTGPPSNFDKLRRDDGDKADAPPRGDIKSSGYESTFAILRRDDGKKFVAPLRNIRSSGPPSNFDKLIRDNSDKAVAPPRFGRKSSGPRSNFGKSIRNNGDNAVALPPDYKPPRPTSRFMRRSPIPISNPAEEEAKTIPKKQPPSVIVREPLKRDMSLSDKLQAIIDKPRPPKPELKWDLNDILKVRTTPKFRIGGSDIAKVEPELKPKLKSEAATLSEVRDVPKAEPELEAMTLSELKDEAKARGLKGYTKLKKAKLLEILKGTPP